MQTNVALRGAGRGGARRVSTRFAEGTCLDSCRLLELRCSIVTGPVIRSKREWSCRFYRLVRKFNDTLEYLVKQRYFFPTLVLKARKISVTISQYFKNFKYKIKFLYVKQISFR